MVYMDIVYINYDTLLKKIASVAEFLSWVSC